MYVQCYFAISSDNYIQGSKKSHQMFHINMVQVLEECPPLKGSMEEVPRVRSTKASGRMVMRDPTLNNQYLPLYGLIRGAHILGFYP